MHKCVVGTQPGERLKVWANNSTANMGSLWCWWHDPHCTRASRVMLAMAKEKISKMQVTTLMQSTTWRRKVMHTALITRVSAHRRLRKHRACNPMARSSLIFPTITRSRQNATHLLPSLILRKEQGCHQRAKTRRPNLKQPTRPRPHQTWKQEGKRRRRRKRRRTL
jgi:hypothetical protein